MSFNFDDYQTETDKTAVYPDAGEGTSAAIEYTLFGLLGEAGELANKYKKVLRDHDGEITPEIAEALMNESGDVLWYLARLCTEMEWNLGDVAADNIEKLLDRQGRGMLKGSGDNR